MNICKKVFDKINLIKTHRKLSIKMSSYYKEYIKFLTLLMINS